MRLDLMKAGCTDKEWEGRANCLHCVIRDHVLFADLTIHELEKLVSPIECLTIAPNAILYRSGSNAEAIYTIRSGLIKLMQFLPNGSVRTVRLLRQFDNCGLEAILHQPYRHTAVAIAKTELCRIPAEVILALKKEDTDFCRQIFYRMQNSLNEADRFIIEFSTGSAESRLARLLLFLAESSQNSCFNKIAREDIASSLGITIETASRIMADFKRRGIINCEPRHPCVCRPEKLRLIAEDL